MSFDFAMATDSIGTWVMQAHDTSNVNLVCAVTLTNKSKYLLTNKSKYLLTNKSKYLLTNKSKYLLTNKSKYLLTNSQVEVTSGQIQIGRAHV